MACECDSGKFGCSCCCASVTGLKAGIHPDHIRSTTADLVHPIYIAGSEKTHYSTTLINEPGHIVSVTAALFAIKRDATEGSEANQLQLPGSTGYATVYAATPVGFSLFTMDNFTTAALNDGGFGLNMSVSDPSGRTYLMTGAVTSYSPAWKSPEDTFGLFFDGALFCELNVPTNAFGVRVTVNYVPRLEFSPSYTPPLETLKHYWTCGNTAPFLEGLYGGVSYDVESSGLPSVTESSPVQSSFSGSFVPQPSEWI